MSMWKLDNTKLLFLGIPKNASTTIRRTLKMDQIFVEGERMFNEMHDSGYTTFTVIRNPIERLVSGYIEIIHRDIATDGKHLKELGYKHEGDVLHSIEDVGKRFEKFISFIANGFDEQHIRPQVEFIKNLHIDKYLRFDTIKDDLKSLCLEFDINPPLELKMHNETPSIQTKKDTMIYIMNAPGLLDTVLTLYKKDWEFYDNCKYAYEIQD